MRREKKGSASSPFGFLLWFLWSCRAGGSLLSACSRGVSDSCHLSSVSTSPLFPPVLTTGTTCSLYSCCLFPPLHFQAGAVCSCDQRREVALHANAIFLVCSQADTLWQWFCYQPLNWGEQRREGKGKRSFLLFSLMLRVDDNQQFRWSCPPSMAWAPAIRYHSQNCSRSMPRTEGAAKLRCPVNSQENDCSSNIAACFYMNFDLCHGLGPSLVPLPPTCTVLLVESYSDTEAYSWQLCL